MSHWIDLRKRAREQHAALVRAAGGKHSAQALLEAAESITGIQRVPCRAGDPILTGAEAFLDLDDGMIWFNQDVDPTMAVFYQMHEYGHFWLHGGSFSCSKTDLDPEMGEEDSPVGIARVEGYGPQERKEREANVFAREVLLPAHILRNWFIEEGAKASAISTRVGVPLGMVCHQLSHSVLVSDLSGEAEKKADRIKRPPLDKDQKLAAEWQRGPLLVEAGPGTGKTSTLVGRIEFLLKEAVSPQSILALTFSNKAAEEMRSRVALSAPSAAPLIWMGTFHAFGLELLRKYGARLGLPHQLSVIDPVDALFLLERELPSLDLVWYQNLYDPAMYLRSMLGAISRAKDELIAPSDYAELAQKMRTGATTAETVEAAEKALEVARVYAVYQEKLDQNSLLDFGDLIFKSVVLLRQNPDVRATIRATYSHILVDEYQDINRASGIFLRELSNSGKGLWVVGDARQAIYRFRGAAPVNMRLFTEDFQGAEIRPLKLNYRSYPAIVSAFSSFAGRMQVETGTSVPVWEPQRTSSPGEIRMEIAEDAEAEADGIALEIERNRAAGVPYRDQAVLCRSHSTLSRIALRVEQAGVPVLYLGDLFERSEIRDLLSLLSLCCEGHGHGLLRVARFLEYRIPLADVMSLIKNARARNTPFPEALRLIGDIQEVSNWGKERFALLSEHLEGLCHGTSAWSMLVQYLFERSKFLDPYVADPTVIAQQQRLAIHQFLQFAYDMRERLPKGSKDPKRAFLNYVRGLEIYGEERQLRQVPEWASGINAVRFLTVHASKGLEFKVVYMPGLGQGYFPARRQHNPCPPPATMLPFGENSAHEEEEECLFFVAMSRGRDSLCLSRAKRYGKQNSNPSRLLERISAVLPRHPDGHPSWRGVRESVNVLPIVASAPPSQVFDARDLEVYIQCPKRYYYEVVLGASRRSEDSPYVRFHKCVYRVIRWMGEEHSQGHIVDEVQAKARLSEEWEAAGPRGHAYEMIYWRNAAEMVVRAVNRTSSAGPPLARPTWSIKRPQGVITLTPDHIERSSPTNERPRVVRFRTGRPSKSEMEKDIYALYQIGGRQTSPRCEIQVVYLSTGDVQQVALTDRAVNTRLAHYDQAIEGIIQKQFHALPSDRNCPRCAHYFVCPLAEDN